MALSYADRYGIPPADEAWRAKAERFAREEVAPRSREADRSGRFPADLVPRMGALGLLAAPIAREDGGGGASTLAYALISEEVGRVDGSVRGFLAVHGGLATQTVARFGTPEQRRRWLPDMIAGKAVGCFAVTERGAGSDVAAIATRAHEERDYVVLDGEKVWITNGTVARIALVFATVDPAAGSKGIECFFVPTDAPGFLAEPMPGHATGHRASDHARITLSGVRVPTSARLGVARGGFKVAMAGLDQGRLSVAAGAVGIQAACLDLSLERARTRRQFGKRIGDFQQVGAALAEMRVSLEASRLLVHHAARLVDRGEPATVEVSSAKLFATESALTAATAALKIHGASGYSDECPVERHWRDAIGLTIYEGTSEIQRWILARHLLGKEGAPAGKEPRREDR